MIKYRSIVILTGAGVSAESGVATFRESGGLWEQHKIEDVATPKAYQRNPQLVQDFYNMRRRFLDTVEPNAAHYALAALEKNFAGKVVIVTQNVDDLHERAGTHKLIHMHGQHRQVFCTACDKTIGWRGDLAVDHICAFCRAVGTTRPDIVWFGEMPYYMDMIDDVLAGCDLFISIGTSGTVYPAAGFVSAVRRLGKAHTIEFNLDASECSAQFHEHRHGPATQTVPKYVDTLLGEQR